MPPVGGGEVGEQFSGHRAAGASGQVTGPDGGQQCLGLKRGQEDRRAAGDELQQQAVQAGHGLHTVSRQLVVPVGQQPQRGYLAVLGHRGQIRGPGGNQRDGVGIGRICLPALPGREHAHPRRQLGRHIDDSLPVRDQPLSQVAADPAASSTAHTRSGHLATASRIAR